MKLPGVYFTDLHCNKYTQFADRSDRLEDCLKVIDDVFKLAIKAKAKTILFGGDLGDLPKYVYTKVLVALIRRFRKWFSKYPDITMLAISGNHDQSEKNLWDKPAATFLAAIAEAFPENFILIDNDIIEMSCGVTVAGIPYYEHKACFDKALDSMYEKCLYPNDEKRKVTLLIHQTPEGLPNRHIRPDTSPADPRYGAFDMVLCGHIHQKQIITPKFIVGGNPLHRDLGDVGSEKGIWVLDLANPTDIEFVSRRGRYPEFLRVDAHLITEELRQAAFVVPTSSRQEIKVEGSADASMFNSGLDMKQILTNYWKQVEGADERLLKVGLELCQ